MSFTGQYLGWLLGLVGLVTLGTGCAGWSSPRSAKPLAEPTVSESRQQRHQAAVHAFEQQRDRAQLEAALDRWSQGDIAGCEARLRELIARHPDFVQARVHLAELAWSCDNAAEAESEYRAALAGAADRADIHHALGMLLEATGRGEAASEHLARAAALEPDNEIYRLAR